MSVHPLPPPKPETNASLMRPDISPHRPEISPQLEKMRAYRGKKSKSVFNFLTYSRETWFSFSYKKVAGLDRPIGPSNEIDRVSEFDNSLSFGAKHNALQ